MNPLYIDALPLLPKKMSGIGHYVQNIVHGLQELNHKTILVVPKGKASLLQGRYPDLEIKELPYRHRTMQLLDIFGLAPKIDKTVGKGFYFFGNYENWPLTKDSRSLTCFHDMAFIRMPETIEKKNLFFLRTFYKRWYRRATEIATVSEFSKKEIEGIFGKRKQVSIIPNSVDKSLFSKKPHIESKKVLKKYGITIEDFLLYVGNLEPRKGLDVMLRAYSNYSDVWKRAHPLIIVGGGGWRNEEILLLIDSINKENTYILRPNGYVEDNDLAAFYSRASAIIMPSLYEGYGVPVLEAASCETDAYISNAAALREVVKQIKLVEKRNDSSLLSMKGYTVSPQTAHLIVRPNAAATSLIEVARSAKIR